MNRLSLVCLTLLMCLSLAQVSVYACGESMFRVGFGVVVPPAKTQNPISIAIFKASDNDPDVFLDDAVVSSKLKKAGNQVTQISTSATGADTSKSFDVVIVRADEIDKAKEILGALVSRASFLPVYEKSGSMRSSGGLSLSTGDTIRQILNIVQRAKAAIHI